MNDIQNPLEFSAILTSLKPSVISSTLILMEMLKDNKQEADIDEEDSRNIVALLMYDSLVSKSVKYSILHDFDFTTEGKVILINTNKEQVKKNVEFLLEYLYYRIEAPIDLASC